MIWKPQILIHPHIPKPLHGIAPRVIEGNKWWNEIRQEAYARYNYRCAACGIHKQFAKIKQWLEAHEFWNIDYQTGICTITSIEPLCHACHNFIHSGRLYAQYQNKDIGFERIKTILEHGFQILSLNNLQCFPANLEIAQILKIKTFNVNAYELSINPDLKWLDYKLVWKNKEYRSKFKSEAEWQKYYEKG